MSSVKKMPLLFIGHGSPMNALENNEFTQTLSKIGRSIDKPKAILVISAHWLTETTCITGMSQPKTIHDFYGFPQELFNIQYPAPGSPTLAKYIQNNIINPEIQIDNSWGLDHGTWSILMHMYPQAEIPVLQLSINTSQSSEYHFELGKKLSFLRNENVLIIGSGNIVHNLNRISWQKNALPFDWAIEFDEWVKQMLMQKKFTPLIHDFLKSDAGKLSVPSLDHYLPLLYILGASNKLDTLVFDIEEIQNASISMRSFKFFS